MNVDTFFDPKIGVVGSVPSRGANSCFLTMLPTRLYNSIYITFDEHLSTLLLNTTSESFASNSAVREQTLFPSKYIAI